MDTDLLWSLRGDYSDKKTQLSEMRREYLEAVIIDAHYNIFIRNLIENNIDGYHNATKVIPYIGFGWRHVTFSQLDRIKIGNCGDFIGFMEKNKWNYPERYLVVDEARKIIGYLDQAMRITNGEETGNLNFVMSELWDYFQTLRI